MTKRTTTSPLPSNADGKYLVIWETGLGGRLDATNIVTPLASGIINIAFDHQPWLGDMLGKNRRPGGGGNTTKRGRIHRWSIWRRWCSRRASAETLKP